jgi:hypothetical protein
MAMDKVLNTKIQKDRFVDDIHETVREHIKKTKEKMRKIQETISEDEFTLSDEDVVE